jgi:hypothetical protein
MGLIRSARWRPYRPQPEPLIIRKRFGKYLHERGSLRPKAASRRTPGISLLSLISLEVELPTLEHEAIDHVELRLFLEPPSASNILLSSDGPHRSSRKSNDRAPRAGSFRATSRWSACFYIAGIGCKDSVDIARRLTSALPCSRGASLNTIWCRPSAAAIEAGIRPE